MAKPHEGSEEAGMECGFGLGEALGGGFLEYRFVFWPGPGFVDELGAGVNPLCWSFFFLVFLT